jgi:serine/threonine-protein kinase RsbW
MIQTYRKISLSSELISLNEGEKFIQEFCADCSVDQNRLSEVQSAVLAAASNAIHYGHQEHGPRLFYLECYISDSNSMNFVVSDSGKGFDFNNIPDPTDPGNIEKPCGRGIYLMRKLADKFTFNKGGSEVVLEFELGGS